MAEEPEITESAASAEETVAESTETGSISLAEAFERAQASVAGDAAAEQGPEEEDSHEEAREEGQRAESSSVEAELDRIYSHIRNGTVDRLPPHLRGRAIAIQREIAEAARREYEEEQRTISQLKEKFLELEALKQADPEEFNRLMWESPQAAQYRQFYETMRAEFPDLSPDNPEAAQRIDVEAATRDAVANVFTDMLNVLRDATGLPPAEFDAVRSRSAGPWEFLTGVIKRYAELAVEKEREKIRDEERKAVRYEVQKDYLSEGVVVPRKLPQHVAQAARSGPLSIKEALEIAQRTLNAR